MKRLMVIAFSAVIAGGAFAADVYDYKASVKNPNLKAVKVAGCDTRGTVTLAVKYITTTSIYGYLVDECANCDEGLGNGHGYLVLANTKDKIPGILPADLLAKIWPANGNCCVGSKTEIAEGYLFAGWGKVTRPWGIYLDTWSTGDWGNPSAGLFGPYNRPDDSGDFYDAWLDAAGFGAATAATTGDLCGESTCVVLDNLSGEVIGGLFLCAQSPCEEFLCLDWGLTTDVVTGDWSIKRDTKLAGVAVSAAVEEVYGLGDVDVDALVNAAILKINPKYSFQSVVPSIEYTDGTISSDWPRYQ